MATRKVPKLRPAKPSKSEVEQEESIPLTRGELLDQHDIASGLFFLRFGAKSTPAKEIPLSHAETPIKKLTDLAWNFVHEGFDFRWRDLHPHTEFH